jgi:hypothetical protein
MVDEYSVVPVCYEVLHNVSCSGFVAEGAQVTRYNTELIGDDEIQIYGPGAELLYHAAGASRWINFTTPQAVLQNLAQERIGRSLALPSRNVVSIRVHPGRRAYLRQLADDAFALAMALEPSSMGATLSKEIARALISSDLAIRTVWSFRGCSSDAIKVQRTPKQCHLLGRTKNGSNES